MADDKRSQTQPSAAAGRGGGMSAAEMRHHEERFLKALELLVETGKARTIDDLIRYADQDEQQVAGDYLRGLKNEGLPIDLCFDAVRVHVRIVAHKRNNSLLTDCRDLKVGLIMPLPPHVVDAFLSLPSVTLIVPDGHHLPHNLQQRDKEVTHGSRSARTLATTLDVLVLEAFSETDGLAIDSAAGDIADPRIVRESTRFIVHQRPHRNPEDVPFSPGGHRLDVL